MPPSLAAQGGIRIKHLHSFKLGLFAVLSLADFVLTWRLLQRGDGGVYESNPVANWCLAHSGWLGLAFYKLATVALVAGLAVVLARYRPCAGSFVLVFACSALAGVVVYSSALACWEQVPPSDDSAPEVLRIPQRGLWLDREVIKIRDYSALQKQLSEDLLKRRRGLSEAVEILGRSDSGRSPLWLGILRERYPGCSDEECLAANLITCTKEILTDHAGPADGLVCLLEAEFRANYGRPVPWSDVPRH